VTLFQEAVEVDHGDLDEIGRGALDRRVDGGALGELAQRRIGARDLGDVATAVQQGADVPVPAGLLEDPVQEPPDPFVAVEVAVDVLLRLGLADPQFPGEAEGTHPVDDAEVDHLRAPAHVGAHHLGEDAEEGRGGAGVDVLPGLEDLDQGLVAREMGEHVQLDL